MAQQIRDALAGHGAAARDAVVLLPFSALLPPTRQALAAGGGWMPRVETTRTLAASLGPPLPPLAGEVCGDDMVDALSAAALLRQTPAFAARERHDRRAFAHVAELLVDAAQALRRGALVRVPHERAGWWALARERCPAVSGPGASEAALLRLAMAWAERGSERGADSDRLFALRPAAWVVVRIGGRDALAEAVSAAAGVPTLVIDLDAADAPPPLAGVERWLCDDAEAEAWAAASQVIAALDDGRAPVALVTLDRQSTRRVRALLDRAGVALVDETGWALSTTGAAARVMALLRAALADTLDARLAWLKAWPPAEAAPRALEALEALWRVRRRPPSDGDRAAADALWARAAAQLAAWRERRERPLADWLALLERQLGDDGSAAALRADDAGAQLWQSLPFDRADAVWQSAAQSTHLDLAGFVGWLDQRLEAEPFVPPAAAGAEVVLTPLARAIGRPFAQVVAAGADARHLGTVEPAAALIPDGMAEALGLDGRAARRRRQQLAFAQLLRVPRLSLLRRHRDGDEVLAASPEVELLALDHPLPPERRWLPPLQTLPAQPVPRPLPQAASALPPRLSASTIDALRECPYRFFARAVLRLSDADELDAELAKRDWGNWLHAVLLRFHSDRVPGQDDAAALRAAADAPTADAARWLPYRAAFDPFADAYVAWLAGRDAAGFVWQGGEVEREAAPPELAPQRLHGFIDRLDATPGGALQLIDYKTGAPKKLKERAAQPLEDTQLAVYAALEPQARSAAYLALDEQEAPVAIEHDGDVAASAAALLRHLGGELQRVRAGAPLPALGEGAVCDHCEARGLCRRDHW